MTKLLASILLALPLLAAPVCEASADPTGVTILYSPGRNLEVEDIRLIETARTGIDMAAYTLTSFAIMDALADAGRRGVGVRLLLDASQLRQTRDFVRERLERLGRVPGVSISVSRGRDLMHLKSYAIDDMVLRTGSANFTPTGLKRQNNDLIVIRDRGIAISYKTMFSDIFAGSQPLSR